MRTSVLTYHIVCYHLKERVNVAVPEAAAAGFQLFPEPPETFPLLKSKRWVRGENIRKWSSRNVFSAVDLKHPNKKTESSLHHWQRGLLVVPSDAQHGQN